MPEQYQHPEHIGPAGPFEEAVFRTIVTMLRRQTRADRDEHLEGVFGPGAWDIIDAVPPWAAELWSNGTTEWSWGMLQSYAQKMRADSDDASGTTE